MSDSQLFPKPSEPSPPSPEPRRLLGRRPLTALLVALSLTVLGGALGKGCGSLLVRLAPAPKPIDITPALWTWKTYSPDGLRMTLELPGEPLEAASELPPEAREKVVSFRTYSMDEPGIGVVMVHWEYAPSNLMVIDTEERAGFFLEGMKNSGEMSEVQYTLNYVSPTETGYRGQLKRQGVAFDLNGFVRSRGLRVWNVFTFSTKESASARAASERVLKSVALD